MAESHLRGDIDYQSLFDPKAYLNRYFAEPMVHIKFALETVHQIYNTGKIKGRRIIDVGSGPTIHMMIPAAKWFDEIYISDFSTKNIDAQKKWLARDPDSYNWKPFFQYFAQKDGRVSAWPEYEKLLREKIKGVLACDMHQPNPLHPETLGQFDAVSTSLAMESGSKSLEQYKNAMKNIVSLVAPGGYIIIYTVFKNSCYAVGEEIFSCFPVTREEMMESVKETELKIEHVYESECKVVEELSPYEGGLVVVGKRKQTETDLFQFSGGR